MEIAAYLVTAVLVEGRGVREVARDHGVSKTWLYELLARYQAEGEAGFDAGAETIGVHLRRAHRRATVPSNATIWRVLKARGFVTPEPHKRPKSS